MREKGLKASNWKCADCLYVNGQIKNKQTLISRNCSLPEYKSFLVKGNRLGIRLADNTFMDTCPVSTLDFWALQMHSEYIFQKELGLDPDLPEITYRAFNIIMIQRAKISKIQDLERERVRKKDK